MSFSQSRIQGRARISTSSKSLARADDIGTKMLSVVSSIDLDQLAKIDFGRVRFGPTPANLGPDR